MAVMGRKSRPGEVDGGVRQEETTRGKAVEAASTSNRIRELRRGGHPREPRGGCVVRS